jgi:hypothetical protein
MSDSEEGYDDPADVTDADVFHDLLCTANHNRATHDDTQGTPEDATQHGPTELDDQTNTADLETESTIVIDKFPFGSPGMPIPGMLQGSSAYKTLQSTHVDADTSWAPFSSQLDWEIARWAKMRSQSSTAVTELLAIPEVCSSYSPSSMPLIQKIGCREAWIIVSHCQRTE